MYHALPGGVKIIVAIARYFGQSEPNQRLAPGEFVNLSKALREVRMVRGHSLREVEERQPASRTRICHSWSAVTRRSRRRIRIASARRNSTKFPTPTSCARLATCRNTKGPLMARAAQRATSAVQACIDDGQFVAGRGKRNRSSNTSSSCGFTIRNEEADGLTETENCG